MKKRARSVNKIGKPDTELLSIIIIMLVFGLIMVGSASSVTSLYKFGDSFHFLKKQFLVAVVGFVAMMIISYFDYHIWLKPLFLFPTYIVVWILMLVAGITGEELNGAKRWITVAGASFQPSEPAKIVLILLTVFFCAKQSQKAMRSFTKGFCFYIGIILISAVPLIVEKHKSATMIFALLVMAIAFVGGLNIKHILFSLPFGIGAVALWFAKDAYSMERIKSMFNPFMDAKDTGYQAVQSLYAIGSGGLFGLGLGRSQQKVMYIPEPQNDFIFSIICEELGFIGALVVIILFILFMFRCIKVISEAPDKAGKLIGVGFTVLIIAQFIINLMVVTAFGPVTGMPLPFFSAGGTNLLFTLMGMGILLNVSRQSVKRQPVPSVDIRSE